MAITNPGSGLNTVPGVVQQATSQNYLDFTGGANDWAQQYLPDLMEKEAEVFGPRTISGFLSPTLYSKPLKSLLNKLLVLSKNTFLLSSFNLTCCS